MSPYDALEPNAANYAPLTPLSFLAWAARAYPNRTSGIHGQKRYTWQETYTRARRLASALQQQGIGHNDTVAVMLANTPEMYEAHFGIPMAGAVINTLNTRLDAGALSFMLRHGDAKALITDRAFSPLMRETLDRAGLDLLIIDVDDSEYLGDGDLLGSITYENLLLTGNPHFAWQPPSNEWDAIALSYTSGTTGDPKGVVTHHRGAYLAAVGNTLTWDLPSFPVYLWTVPMFHCNGWCHPWTIAAKAGANVFLRKVEARAMLEAIRDHRVTHFGGAPIVHTMLLNAPDDLYAEITHTVNGFIAGAAPPVAVLEAMERRGFRISHIYGLTETYGPATYCAKHPEWDDLPLPERAKLNGRQGIPFVTAEGLAVMDPDTMQAVPADGETMGEVMIRGNLTMKGYLRNPASTAAAFAGGWFHSGDLAVLEPDGYIKIKDRSKDIIISGGENISSLEVEDIFYRHPAILVCAVVAQPDPQWGETPVAFVELREGAAATEAELIGHCRQNLAHYKCPKRVIFGPIPRTSTGKIQKYALRERVKSAAAIDV